MYVAVLQFRVDLDETFIQAHVWADRSSRFRCSAERAGVDGVEVQAVEALGQPSGLLSALGRKRRVFAHDSVITVAMAYEPDLGGLREGCAPAVHQEGGLDRAHRRCERLRPVLVSHPTSMRSHASTSQCMSGSPLFHALQSRSHINNRGTTSLS